MPLSTAAWVAIGAAVTTLASSSVAAYGSIQQGEAAKESAKYNSEVAANNAIIAQQSATRAAQTGEAQAAVAEQQSRAKIGGIITSQAAGGIDVNSGSALDVQSSADATGQLNALTIRSNAAQTAYGLQTQSASDTGQSQLDTFQGNSAATAGDIGASSNVIGGLGSAASNYSNFQLKNGLNASSYDGTIGTATGNYYDQNS